MISQSVVARDPDCSWYPILLVQRVVEGHLLLVVLAPTRRTGAQRRSSAPKRIALATAATHIGRADAFAFGASGNEGKATDIEYRI